MKEIKLNLHSVVDLITNSSTVIFTYQDSVKQTKDLVNEILKLLGTTDKTADDIFYYGVFIDDYYRYLESPNFIMPEGITDAVKYFRSLQLSILKGEIEKPQWMDEVEDNMQDYYEWAPSRTLHLIAKDEKYEPLANKIKLLLDSVSADGGFDG